MIKTIRDFSSDSYTLFEHGVSIPGLSDSYSCVLVILGTYSSGLFVALPELGISCNLSWYDFKTDYNKEQLMKCGLNSVSARELALYIETWLRCNSKFLGKRRQENFDLLQKRIKMLSGNDTF